MTPGLKKSYLGDVQLSEPHEIRAHEDGVELDVFFTEDERRVVNLRPRHLHKIRTMFEDWWESHWKELHEEEA